MAAKTVKVSRTTKWNEIDRARERRVPLHDVKPDGSAGYAVLCNADEKPNMIAARVSHNWKRYGSPIIGSRSRPQQWWIAV